MELTYVERLKLLQALPPEGDLLTLKIVRKLRETLSFSEEDLKALGASYEYGCQHTEIVEGKPVPCNNKGFFPDVPTCGLHNEIMKPTGQLSLNLTPEVQLKAKDIHMGTAAHKIASNALEQLNNQKQLTEAHVSLYDKFFPPEEEEDVPNKGEKS